MTLTEIVAAAVDLADASGLAGVSMSKVAKALGFTTMSLYRYVSSKDDLVILMADAALGSPPPRTGPPLPWRDALSSWTRSLLAVYREHPWITDVPISGPPAAPQSAWPRLPQPFIDSGLTFQEQPDIVAGQRFHPRPGPADERDHAQRRAGLARHGGVLQPDDVGLIDPERFPACP
jgi:AcrR family transcriptional regulator